MKFYKKMWLGDVFFSYHSHMWGFGVSSVNYGGVEKGSQVEPALEVHIGPHFFVFSFPMTRRRLQSRIKNLEDAVEALTVDVSKAQPPGTHAEEQAKIIAEALNEAFARNPPTP